MGFVSCTALLMFHEVDQKGAAKFQPEKLFLKNERLYCLSFAVKLGMPAFTIIFMFMYNSKMVCLRICTHVLACSWVIVNMVIEICEN